MSRLKAFHFIIWLTIFSVTNIQVNCDIAKEDEEDTDLNVLLTKIQDLQEESRNMNNHMIKKINELKVNIQKVEDKMPNIDPGLRQAVNNDNIDDNNVQNQVEQFLSKMDNRLHQLDRIFIASQKSNKAVLDMISKNTGQGPIASQAVTLPSQIKKEISERISSEFVQMKQWIANTVDRLGGMERSCVSLAQSVEKTKNQCIDKLGEQVENKGFEDFKEEVSKNFSRVERDLKQELEKMVQNMEWKTRSPVLTTRGPETTEHVLPTFPPTIPPRFPVNIPCNSKVLTKKPENCADVKHRGGATCDGIYVIYPQKKKPVIALCDMNTLDGGWTVIMRRGQFRNVRTNFDKPWSAYKNGFGRTKGEFWLGNEHVHLLTSSASQRLNNSQELLVQVESFQGEQLNLMFEFIYLEDEQHNYRLHLGNVSGNFDSLASSFSVLNNRTFRTKDRNMGEDNCASRHSGGWWYDEFCDQMGSVLTAPLFAENDFRERWQGILWPSWKGDSVLKSAQMKIRNRNMQE